MERSLASIYEHTTLPFRLVYVSGGAPLPVLEHLRRESEAKGFELLHTEHYLSPNQARNLGISHVRTKYVVFLDNDALVTPGWLESLLSCAEETGAWVVGPLYMIGEFKRATIHMAGGRLRTEERDGKRVLWDEQYLYDTPISQANMRLRRRPCEYVEFHCMLVRTDAFEHIGPLDEKLLSLHEERDICLATLRAGGSVYIEPKSVVSYVPPPPCEWWDLPYFMLRWSEAWSLASVRHFNSKWDIAGVRHVSDSANSYEEGTIVGFARAWRSRVAGMQISAEDGAGPKLPLEQAQLMIAMFVSVDREYFDLALAIRGGKIIESWPALSPPSILERLPSVIEQSEAQNLDVLVRPAHQGRDDQPTLIRLDELSADEMRRIDHLSFMCLETSPGRYQCWLAANKRTWFNVSTAAGWKRPASRQRPTNHFVRLAGTGMESQGQSGHRRVRFVHGATGHLVTAKQLEGGEARPFLSACTLS